ncbi:Protein LIN1 [Candida viswanathii]|uniref:Protein LIN1 n=1 Tax=Candida viswanathii TaxID=5486 RepID=A0A367Y941_9ASCO|nr:Protein LIN1 [Candida viswanathii]
MNNGDEDDIIELNDDEVLGKTRKQKQRLRNQVKLNYDSDSSDEEEDEDEATVEQKQEEDDMFASDKEDDMFADGNGDEKPEASKKSKKTPQFLDISEVEGQEQLNSASDDTDDDEEGEVDHDYYNNIEEINIDIKKKKKAPKIEAFNLEEEANEGNFDLEGNYIRNDENPEGSAPANDDQWLDDFKKKDIKKAKKAQQERERKQMARLLESNTNMEPIETLLSGLIDILDPDESPMEALARLNPNKKSKTKKGKHENGAGDVLIQRITDLCSTLINDKYLDDVYELTREELMRKYQMETGEAYNVKRGVKREREDDDENEIDYGEKIWEFRWIGEEEINGPYSNYEMNHWKQTYFEDKVEVRKVGETEFQHVSFIEFD